MTLNYLQRKAFRAMKKGSNIFLTGKGGSGKTFLVEKYIKIIGNKKNVVICAPTGVAASHLGGVTMHRLFKIPIILNNLLPKNDVLEAADIIIIDEISMCRKDNFDFITKAIMNCKNWKRKQIIVVGDFYQLSPVVKKIEKEDSYMENPFCFSSQSWNEFGFRVFYLKDCVRQQGDIEYINALNKTREGISTGLDYINKHSNPLCNENSIILCPYNKQVDKININKLNELEGDSHIYKGKLSVKNEFIAEYKKDISISENIELKVGARVMTLVNDKQNRYQNGSLGYILSMNEDVVTVETDKGNIVEIRPYEFPIIDYFVKDMEDGNKKVLTRIVANFIQMPLKLAYAITIHKSQGMTYDKINLFPHCFAEGQLYVALSRVTSLKGLHLVEPINPEWLLTSSIVKDFYNRLEMEQNCRERNVENKKSNTISPNVCFN